MLARTNVYVMFTLHCLKISEDWSKAPVAKRTAAYRNQNQNQTVELSDAHFFTS